MIISFTLENWKSFRDPVTMSMVASRERQHGSRVQRLGKYRTRVLPVAAFYGGNASGKTNLFKALNFAKRLVVEGTRPDDLISVEPFLLDDRAAKEPTRFQFVLWVKEKIYDFSFVINRHAVLEEKLIVISSKHEQLLYDRRGHEIKFSHPLDGDMFLDFDFRGTRNNQLFLTNTVYQNIDTFRPVFDWFRNTLKLIAPDTRFSNCNQFIEEGNPLLMDMNDYLKLLDIGIVRLGSEEIAVESIGLPNDLKADILGKVKEGTTARLHCMPGDERFVVARSDGNLSARKLVSFHSGVDRSEVKFEINQESDGSQRVIDLLPALLNLSMQSTEMVYVVDEIDRSLHSILMRSLLGMYLSSCTKATRKQLLLTTHDLLLMDQQLMRRDEMWITERDVSGSSTLYSFSDYRDSRSDSDVRRSYVQGRLGGIPRVFSGELLAGLFETYEKSAIKHEKDEKCQSS